MPWRHPGSPHNPLLPLSSPRPPGPPHRPLLPATRTPPQGPPPKHPSPHSADTVAEARRVSRRRGHRERWPCWVSCPGCGPRAGALGRAHLFRGGGGGAGARPRRAAAEMSEGGGRRRRGERPRSGPDRRRGLALGSGRGVPRVLRGGRLYCSPSRMGGFIFMVVFFFPFVFSLSLWLLVGFLFLFCLFSFLLVSLLRVCVCSVFPARLGVGRVVSLALTFH